MSISTIIIFLVGLALVVFGSDLLVEGACDIARRSGISEFVIGLTIVGIGTSTPEMVVSFLGALQGSTDISVGNIIGSNIFNTCMILGVTALILPMAITRETLHRDIPLNITVTLLLILLGLKHSIFGIGSDSLGRLDGAFMLLTFAAYMYLSFRNGKDGNDRQDKKGGQNDGSEAGVGGNEVRQDVTRALPVSIIYVVGGLAALIFGGRLFVNNAVQMAQYFGWSDKFIAITVLAAGTSLPELATCVVAAVKKKGQLALGNIIGSNVSNILLILGGSALIHPLPMDNIKLVDFGFVLLAAFFLLVCNFTFDRRKLDRIEGVCLLLMEACYMFILIAEL